MSATADNARTISAEIVKEISDLGYEIVRKDALSSQSLSLSEAREEIERLKKLPVIADYIEVQTQSRAAMDALRKFADFKNCTAADVYRARELTGLLHLNAQDNFAASSTQNIGKNVSEDRQHVSGEGERLGNSDPDLSSLRKGAEELRRSLICVKQQCETAVFNISQREHDEAVVRSFQSIADYCARALVSGSREDGA